MQVLCRPGKLSSTNQMCFVRMIADVAGIWCLPPPSALSEFPQPLETQVLAVSFRLAGTAINNRMDHGGCYALEIGGALLKTKLSSFLRDLLNFVHQKKGLRQSSGISGAAQPRTRPCGLKMKARLVFARLMHWTPMYMRRLLHQLSTVLVWRLPV